MTVQNISLNDSVKVQSTPMSIKQDTVVVNNATANDLQRQPQDDNFNGKGLDKKKIITYASFGTVLATLVGIALDFKFAEGKHVKNLWRKLTGNAQDIKPKSTETPNVGGEAGVNTPNIPDKPDVVQPKSNVDIEPPIVKNEPTPALEPEKVSDVKIEPPKEGQVNNDIVVPKATEPKRKSKTTQSEKPNSKPKPIKETITEKEYIDRETLSPVKEKWQGKTLLERTIKTDDGLVTTSYRNGKVESVFTNGDISQELKVYYLDSKTVKETYFRNMGTLYIERGNKNIVVPHVKEEQFEEAVKLSQKYAEIPEVELESLYREVLSGNPNNMSFMEFNVLEAHRDVYRLTIPKTSEATQIKEHHYLNGKNHIYRDTPEKLEGNGKTFDDFTDGEWDALSREEKRLCDRNENYLRYNAEMKRIDKALQALPPLEKDCVFYRGIGEIFIPDSIINGKVGDIVVPDNGYAYTAFNRELADRFGGHQYIIRTPKGAKVSRNMEHGGEAVFPRNAEYRIISKTKTPANDIYPDGQWRIELEYILPKS